MLGHFDKLLHFGGIDEGVQLAGFQLLALFFQIEKSGVRREEDIAGHLSQLGETSLRSRPRCGIVGVVHQLVDHRGAAVEDHLIRFAGFGNGHGPGGAAFGVAGRDVRGEGDAAQLHGLPIADHAIDCIAGNGTAPPLAAD